MNEADDSKVGRTFYCEPCDLHLALRSLMLYHLTSQHDMTSHDAASRAIQTTSDITCVITANHITHAQGTAGSDDDIIIVDLTTSVNDITDKPKDTSSPMEGRKWDSFIQEDGHGDGQEDGQEDQIGGRIELNMTVSKKGRIILTTPDGKKLDRTCTYCGKECKGPYALERHLRVHTKHRPFSCPVCHRGFSLKENMHKHAKTHDTPATSNSKSSKGRKLHFRDKKLKAIKRGLLGCFVKTEKKESKIGQKGISEMKRKRRTCACCNVVWKSPADMLRHLRSNNKERSFACSVCDRKFMRKCDVTRHAKRHMKSTASRTRAGRQPFVKDSSSKVIAGNDICVKDTTSKGITFKDNADNAPALKVSEVIGITESDLQSECHDLVKTEVYRKVTKNRSDRTCMFCKRVFSKPSLMRRHLRTHTKERPFSCPFCDATFRYKTGMKRHALRHIKEENDDDNAGRGATGQMKSDRRSAQQTPGDKVKVTDRVRSRRDHTCPHCDHVFKSAADLRRHVMTHTGERPYACPICDRRFTRKKSLTDHLRRHVTATGEIRQLRGQTNEIRTKNQERETSEVKSDKDASKAAGIPKSPVSDKKGRLRSSVKVTRPETKVTGKTQGTIEDQSDIRYDDYGNRNDGVMLDELLENSGDMKLSKIKRFYCNSCDKNLQDKRSYRSHILGHLEETKATTSA